MSGLYAKESNVEIGASDLLTATGDGLVFTPGVPAEIISFGMIMTVGGDDSGGDGCVLKLDKRVTAGSDTGRGDGDLGTLTMTLAQVALAVAGSVIRARPNTNEDAYAGPGPVEASRKVMPGEQAVLQVTDVASTAGTGLPFIEWKPIADEITADEQEFSS